MNEIGSPFDKSMDALLDVLENVAGGWRAYDAAKNRAARRVLISAARHLCGYGMQGIDGEPEFDSISDADLNDNDWAIELFFRVAEEI